MITIRRDETHEHIIWWEILPPTTWKEYGEAVDGIKTEAIYENAKILIVHPKTDMPKDGSPISYLRHCSSTIKAHPSIDYLIAILDNSLPLSETFGRIVLQVFNVDHVKLVKSTDEAMQIALETGEY